MPVSRLSGPGDQLEAGVGMHNQTNGQPVTWTTHDLCRNSFLACDYPSMKPLQVTFSYSVKWTSTPITFDQRLQRYERFPLNPIHLEVRLLLLLLLLWLLLYLLC
eukprot:GHUV01036461.1.p1 GENE.GHUV01036461.1~~GHUV01036461.1.p1  ORF type:complete len:105 (-),score=23.14 GHUV01036461.1:50-364(-)